MSPSTVRLPPPVLLPMAISKFRTRSTLESYTISDLKERQVDFQYEPHRIKYMQVQERSYTPDILLANGIYVEVKGYFTSLDRVKHLLIKKSNPDLDIRFLFQRANNKLSKTSKTTYSAWCEKHGFLWAEKCIPQEWINEKPKSKRKEKKLGTGGLVSAGPEKLYN